MNAGEDRVEHRKRTLGESRVQWRKVKFPTVSEKNTEKVWKTMAWTTCDGDFHVVKSLRSILRWRTAWSIMVDPMNMGFHNE